MTRSVFIFVLIFRVYRSTFFTICFRIKYIKPTDDTYGHLSSNGTIHGQIRMVNKSEADVSIDPFDFNRETREYVDYLPSIWKNR
jgi:hypothetical protein